MQRRTSAFTLLFLIATFTTAHALAQEMADQTPAKKAKKATPEEKAKPTKKATAPSHGIKLPDPDPTREPIARLLYTKVADLPPCPGEWKENVAGYERLCQNLPIEGMKAYPMWSIGYTSLDGVITSIGRSGHEDYSHKPTPFVESRMGEVYSELVTAYAGRCIRARADDKIDPDTQRTRVSSLFVCEPDYTVLINGGGPTRGAFVSVRYLPGNPVLFSRIEEARARRKSP